jgi:DNA-directed RNA polymerase I subunit RPA12
MPSGSSSLLVFAPDAPFCPRCGTLLVLPDAGRVRCDLCAFSVALAELPRAPIVTRSFPKPEPAWLVEHRAAAAAAAARAAREAGGAAADAAAAAGGGGGVARATVSEECPRCKAPTMEFYTLQLRSADEGQTVFYECAGSKGCGFKFSLNT